MPVVQPRPYGVPFWPNYAKPLELVASGLLNSYMKFRHDWSYEVKTICPYLGIRTKFDRLWPINWPNVTIFE